MPFTLFKTHQQKQKQKPHPNRRRIPHISFKTSDYKDDDNSWLETLEAFQRRNQRHAVDWRHVT
jgi:hypothetical protein